MPSATGPGPVLKDFEGYCWDFSQALTRSACSSLRTPPLVERKWSVELRPLDPRSHSSVEQGSHLHLCPQLLAWRHREASWELRMTLAPPSHHQIQIQGQGVGLPSELVKSSQSLGPKGGASARAGLAVGSGGSGDREGAVGTRKVATLCQ